METNQPFLKEGRLRELENDSSIEISSYDAPVVSWNIFGQQRPLRWVIQRPVLMHLLLVLTYTSAYLYLTRYSLTQTCDERDLIYCEDFDSTSLYTYYLV